MAFKKPNLPKATEAEQFINKAGASDYSALTLDELAHEYESIDQQSQMLKGRILLEARNRFKSDNEFGDWVVGVGLSDTSRQTRNVYMNLARFFQDRDMTGISLTAAYEISRPQNSDIAEEIYNYSIFKNLPVSEVKQRIKQIKSITTDVIEKTELLSDEANLEEVLLNQINNMLKKSLLSEEKKIKVLKSCIKFLKSNNNSPASEDAGE
jgi:hypothetical protein